MVAATYVANLRFCCASCSQFTLVKNYLLILFQIRQCAMIKRLVSHVKPVVCRLEVNRFAFLLGLRLCSMVCDVQVRDAVLVKAVANYLKVNPTKTLAAAIASVAKHKIPGTMVGSPSWFRDQLSGLLAMVQCWRMPTFFLTLTAGDKKTKRLGLQWDEVSRCFSRPKHMYGLCTDLTGAIDYSLH
jgi:hypothetical protein